jgi:hypothetical protein
MNGIYKEKLKRMKTMPYTLPIQKGLPMSKKEKLEAIYEKIFAEAVEHMKDYETQMVAGTLMAIAMRLYKTSLTDEGFREMMQTIVDVDVKSYFDKDETIH